MVSIVNFLLLAYSLLVLLLSNEFISASRNFYSLLLYGVEHNIYFLFNDIHHLYYCLVLIFKVQVHGLIKYIELKMIFTVHLGGDLASLEQGIW